MKSTIFLANIRSMKMMDDTQRRSVIECWLYDLEFLFQDCPPNDGNGNGDGPYSNSTWSTHDSQNRPPRPCSSRRPSPDAVVPAYIEDTIERAFKEEWDKVVGNVDLKEIFQCFPDFRSAWKSGVSTVRKLYQCTNPPYPNFDFGSVIAMLCVCSAISKTIDKNNSRAEKFGRRGSYYGHFKHDLERWCSLFREILWNQKMSSQLAIWAVKTIWDVNFFFPVDTSGWRDPPIPNMSFSLDFLLRRADEEDTALEAAQSSNNLQGTSGHCEFVRCIWPYWSHTGKGRLIATWATSAAFSILFIFLTWLRALTAGLETSEISEFLLGSDHLLARSRTYAITSTTRLQRCDRILRNFFDMETARRRQPNTIQESSHASGDSGLACGQCGKTFSSKENRVRHEKDVHGPKKDCKRCGNEYTARGLQTHRCPSEELSGSQSKRRKTSSSRRNGG
ncbi:hypothetical protein F4679DRAFT_533891 [Xylaria curta]|nr:hypothetical protein F4679DRAFT_533891 [Xylaria curta]